MGPPPLAVLEMRDVATTKSDMVGEEAKSPPPSPPDSPPPPDSHSPSGSPPSDSLSRTSTLVGESTDSAPPLDSPPSTGDVFGEAVAASAASPGQDTTELETSSLWPEELCASDPIIKASAEDEHEVPLDGPEATEGHAKTHLGEAEEAALDDEGTPRIPTGKRALLTLLRWLAAVPQWLAAADRPAADDRTIVQPKAADKQSPDEAYLLRLRDRTSYLTGRYSAHAPRWQFVIWYASNSTSARNRPVLRLYPEACR